MGTHEEVNEMNGSLILVTCLLFLILRGRRRLHRVFGGFESHYYYAGNEWSVYCCFYPSGPWTSDL